MGKRDSSMLARRVTARHGEVFRAEMRGQWARLDELWVAVEATGLLRWPDEESFTETPAQARFGDLMEEILTGTFEIAEDAIATAFVKSASAVIERERGGRQRVKGRR